MAFRGIQTTNIISTDVGLTDPLLILNKDGSTATDVGFLGKIGSTSYAGLVKDSATNSFILVGSITLSPNTVNDVSALDASLVKGSLDLGALTATSININSNAVATESYVTTAIANIATHTSLVLPKGIESTRPASPVEGQLFFNTTTKMFEGYNGTIWVQLVPSEFEYTP